MDLFSGKTEWDVLLLHDIIEGLFENKERVSGWESGNEVGVSILSLCLALRHQGQS